MKDSAEGQLDAELKRLEEGEIEWKKRKEEEEAEWKLKKAELNQRKANLRAIGAKVQALESQICEKVKEKVKVTKESDGRLATLARDTREKLSSNAKHRNEAAARLDELEAEARIIKQLLQKLDEQPNLLQKEHDERQSEICQTRDTDIENIHKSQKPLADQLEKLRLDFLEYESSAAAGTASSFEDSYWGAAESGGGHTSSEIAHQGNAEDAEVHTASRENTSPEVGPASIPVSTGTEGKQAPNEASDLDRRMREVLHPIAEAEANKDGDEDEDAETTLASIGMKPTAAEGEVPHRRSRMQVGEGEGSSLSDRFSMVVFLDARWCELQCFVCKCNRPVKGVRFLRGVEGLIKHIVKMHGGIIDRRLVLKYCTSPRKLSKGDIDQMLRGEQPGGAPIVMSLGIAKLRKLRVGVEASNELTSGVPTAGEHTPEQASRRNMGSALKDNRKSASSASAPAKTSGRPVELEDQQQEHQALDQRCAEDSLDSEAGHPTKDRHDHMVLNSDHALEQPVMERSSFPRTTISTPVGPTERVASVASPQHDNDRDSSSTLHGRGEQDPADLMIRGRVDPSPSLSSPRNHSSQDSSSTLHGRGGRHPTDLMIRGRAGPFPSLSSPRYHSSRDPNSTPNPAKIDGPARKFPDGVPTGPRSGQKRKRHEYNDSVNLAILHPNYRSTARFEGTWYLIQCKICMANSEEHDGRSEFFRGLQGLLRHVQSKHDATLELHDMDYWCDFYREVKSDEHFAINQKGGRPITVQANLGDPRTFNGFRRNSRYTSRPSTPARTDNTRSQRPSHPEYLSDILRDDSDEGSNGSLSRAAHGTIASKQLTVKADTTRIFSPDSGPICSRPFELFPAKVNSRRRSDTRSSPPPKRR